MESGVAIAHHFCHEHGEAAWRATVPTAADTPAASLQALQEHWDRLPDTEKEHLALLYRLTRRKT
jgi:hypothetical protein